MVRPATLAPVRASSIYCWMTAMTGPDDMRVSRRDEAPEDLLEMRSVLRMLFRRWSIVACSTVAFLVLGMGICAVVPAHYTASAKLLLKRNPAGFFQQSSTGPQDALDASETQDQIEILKSDMIALSVLGNHAVAPDPVIRGDPRGVAGLVWIQDWFARLLPSSTATGKKPSSAAPRVRDETLRAFRERLSVSRVGTSNVVEVAFTSRDPALSSAIANAVVEAFIQSQLAPAQAASRAEGMLRERLMLSAAVPPTKRDQPGSKVVVGTALLLGLLFGVIGAATREAFDDKIRTPRQGEAATGTTCLGLLPRRPDGRAFARSNRVGGLAGSSGPGFPMLTGIGSLLQAGQQPACPRSTDVLQNARIAADARRGIGGTRVLGVVSALPGEGRRLCRREPGAHSGREWRSTCPARLLSTEA